MKYFKKLIARLLILLLGIAGLTAGATKGVAAQSVPIKFKTLSSNEGLSNSLAWTIAQDDKGFIWIGTYDGLSLYNGYEFKTYRHNDKDLNSISHNYIFGLLFDSRNRLWIGTPKGIDLYDAANDRFIRYSPSLKPGTNNPDTFWLYEDEQKRVWVGTADGIIFFNEELQTFEKSGMTAELGISAQITAFLKDEDGNFWLGTDNDGLHSWNPEIKSHRMYKKVLNDPSSLSENYINTLFNDSQGNLWIGTQDGLNKFNKAANNFKRYQSDPDDPNAISIGKIKCIEESRNGHLWIGTTDGGLNEFDPETEKFTIYKRDSKDPYSLSDNAVKDIMIDKLGGLWVATFRGVSFADDYQLQFNHLEKKEHDPQSLTDNYITTLFTDSQENVWYGNRYGISKYQPKQNNFKHYKHSPNNPSSIPDGAVLNISEDPQGNLWTVTHTGIVSKLDLKSGIFSRYLHDQDDPSSIPPRSNFVYCTRDGNIWVGSIKGISRLDKEQNNYIHFPLPDSTGLGHTLTIFEDSRENIWVTSWTGIYWFDRHTNTFSLKQDLSNKIWPYQPTQIYEDSNENLWIGTAFNGLFFYDSEKETFKKYENNKDLPNIYIKGILEDNSGNIWLSSNEGLCRFNPQTNEYKQYGLYDGLKNKEFTLRSCAKLKDGRLFFGGPKGISVFYPTSLHQNPNPPEVVLTNFQLFNKAVPIGPDSPLQTSIVEANKINLSYKETVLSFEFVALSYNSPEKNQYAYKMEGFDNDWTYSGTRRFASYTNLPPGKTYTFKVKASNNDGVWNEAGTSVQIYINPPFWLTWWFYALVTFLVVLTLFGLYRWRTRQHKRQRRELESMVKERTEEVEHQKDAIAAHASSLKIANQEIRLKNKKIRKQANKLKVIDQLKSRFLANISHELRTPLTLILMPLEEMIAANPKESETGVQLSVMESNAKRLLQLINQLLDLSKIESGKFPLILSSQNIIPFIQNVSNCFSLQAKKQKINYRFFCQEKEILMAFDKDKLEKIIYNLLSNALKFTPEGGNVDLTVAFTELTETEENKKGVNQSKYLKIIVSDTGQGISVKHLPYIFDRFYQAEPSLIRKNEGTGIGLALTKELAKLHGGKVYVKSEQDQGTSFTVLLPIHHEAPDGNINHTDQKHFSDTPFIRKESEKESLRLPEPAKNNTSAHILIVEDNKELRQQVKRILSAKYRVDEAENGIEGWEKANNLMPDLIISDIMMPGKDGLALCQQLKNDPATSHIPTILLSARIDSEEAGLSVGADDYITKPFNVKSLVLKVRNLLETRRKFRKAICKELGISEFESSPENGINVNPYDRSFIKEATDIALKYLSEPDFKMEKFCQELGMSRTLVYKKLKSLTGLSPNDFIRQIRLNKASQMLQDGNLTVADVMFKTGFNHRSYFTKCFKKAFGHLPSEHAEKHHLSKSKEEVTERG